MIATHTNADLVWYRQCAKSAPLDNPWHQFAVQTAYLVNAQAGKSILKPDDLIPVSKKKEVVASNPVDNIAATFRMFSVKA